MLQFSDEAARKLEAIYSSADVVAQRRAMLDRLSLRPGESVIDIGCGPGFLCEEMAVAVAETGTVVGVDISEDLIAFARARNACSWLTYQHGDARALKVPDAYFEVAASAQVLEYLDDPDRAIAEMFRVLKPGGRALIMDTDWDRVAWYSSEPDRMQKVRKSLGSSLRRAAAPANSRAAASRSRLHDCRTGYFSDREHAPRTRHL